MKPFHLLIIGQTLTALLTTQVLASEILDKSEMATGILTGHIVPAYARLDAGAGQLKEAIGASCKDGRRLDREPVRDAFRDALSAWMGVQHIRFGPAKSQDRHYRFQYWPDKHGQGARQMRRLLAAPIGDMPDARLIGQKSVAIQGFPALEQLLFPSREPKAEERAKRCRLAQAISGNLAEMASLTLADWKSYKPKDPQEMIATLVRNLTEQLQIIADLKFKRPMGKSAKEARPRRAESWRSGRSFENIRQNYLALAALFNGGSGAHGLRSAMARDGEDGDAANAIAEHLSYGAAQAGKQKQTLSQIVGTQQGRALVTFLVQHTNATRELVLEHLAPALGVEMGFNAQDGD